MTYIKTRCHVVLIHKNVINKPDRAACCILIYVYDPSFSTWPERINQSIMIWCADGNRLLQIAFDKLVYKNVFADEWLNRRKNYLNTEHFFLILWRTKWITIDFVSCVWPDWYCALCDDNMNTNTNNKNAEIVKSNLKFDLVHKVYIKLRVNDIQDCSWKEISQTPQ